MTTTQSTEKCPHCGASMKMYWHKLTPGITKALIKMRKAVAVKGKNDIRIDKLPPDLALTHIERCNWQKLRMHGLVARVTEDGQVKRGRWLTTAKGNSYLQGFEVADNVQTFRNKVVNHSPTMTTISEVMHSDPYWQGIDDFDYGISRGNINQNQPLAAN